LPTSNADLWDTIAAEAGRESSLWTDALRDPELQEREAIFSTLGEERYALGIETIYEGYLLHYGRPRLFEPEDGDAALLLGDYLYAHGLVRIEQVGSVAAVNDLAELIALCAYLNADNIAGDTAVWAATATDAASSRTADPPYASITTPARWSGSRERVSATLPWTRRWRLIAAA
jgi:hypothetical protein